MRESDFSGSTFNGAYLEKAVAYKANFTGKSLLLLNICWGIDTDILAFLICWRVIDPWQPMRVFFKKWLVRLVLSLGLRVYEALCNSHWTFRALWESILKRREGTVRERTAIVFWVLRVVWGLCQLHHCIFSVVDQ